MANYISSFIHEYQLQIPFVYAGVVLIILNRISGIRFFDALLESHADIYRSLNIPDRRFRRENFRAFKYIFLRRYRGTRDKNLIALDDILLPTELGLILLISLSAFYFKLEGGNAVV